MEEKYIFRTRPAYFFLGFSLIVAAFCIWGTFAFWEASFEPSGDTSQTTILVIRIIFTAVILAFGLSFLWIVVTLKICYLTDQELIISRPILFTKLVLPRSEIINISEADSKIDLNAKNLNRPDWFKIGDTATLLLKNGKKIQLSSVNVGRYRELIKKLRHR